MPFVLPRNLAESPWL